MSLLVELARTSRLGSDLQNSPRLDRRITAKDKTLVE